MSYLNKTMKQPFIVFMISLILLFQTNAYAVQTPTVVGETPGSFNVEQGVGIYTIPIRVPPGINELKPNLALKYNSAGGNGLLGLGWSIAGLSVIYRTGRTMAQDQVKGGVSNNVNDRFSMDGQRLIKISSGAYGNDGTEYRTEIETFSKIISHGSSGNGPLYFTVKTKAGLTMEYGNTADSATGASGQTVQQWMLNKVTDTSGNELTYSYYEDTATGESYITNISYAGDRNSVQFEYENRHDPQIKYLAGSKISMTKRLSNVKTYVGNEMVKNYQLTYKDNADYNQSLLASAQEFDDAGDALPAITFTWELGTNGFKSPTKWLDFRTPKIDQNLNPIPNNYLIHVDPYKKNTLATLMDMDGDGRPDRIAAENWLTGNGGFHVGLNNGTGFDAPSLWKINSDTRINSYEGYPTRVDYEESSEYSGIKSTLMDINGDGRPDRIGYYEDWDDHAGDKISYLAINNGAGFDAPIMLYRSTSEKETPWDSNGGPTIKDADQSILDMLMDMDGDGRPDRIAYKNWLTGDVGFHVGINNGNSFGSPIRWLGADATPGIKNYPIHNTSRVCTRTETSVQCTTETDASLMDINGDGLPDRIENGNWVTNASGIHAGLNNGADFESPAMLTNFGGHILESTGGSYIDSFGLTHSNRQEPRFIDINADGLLDNISWYGLIMSYKLNKGNQTFQEYNSYLLIFNLFNCMGLRSDGDGNVYGQFIDMNNDGLLDVISATGTPHCSLTTGITNGIQVALNNGHGFDSFTEWKSGQDKHLSNLPLEANLDGATTAMFMDMNGDGLPDRIENQNWEDTDQKGIYVGINKSHKAVISSIENGMGITSNIEYQSLSNPDVHTKGNTAVYPAVDIAGPGLVVSEVTSSDGIGGTNRVLYTYGGAKAHAKGRGSLGFKWIESINDQSQMVIKTEYRQDFPYVGKPESLAITHNTLPVKKVTDTYDEVSLHSEKVHFPYLSQSIKETYKLDGSLISTETTTNSDLDDFGNARQSMITMEGGGKTFAKTTTNTYNNDQANWFLGQLLRSSTTFAAPAEYGSSKTSASTFTYDPDTWLLLTKTMEPGDQNLRLTETYQYDGFGNKISVSVDGPGAEPRTRTIEYDANGMFPVRATNPLGHSETMTYNPRWGVVTQLTGPNGITTQWEYDALGRKIKETRADNTQTTWLYAWSSAADAGRLLGNSGVATWELSPTATYKVIEKSTGAPEKTVYYDALDRAIRQKTIGFDGREVFQDVRYNHLGQKTQSSLPFFQYESSHFIETEYDALGRPTTITRPGPGGVDSVNRVTYNGLVVTEINALGQNKITTKDAVGNVILVNEAEGANVTYSYDATGNLVQTNAGGAITTISYDNRNRKISMDDPDMGHWEYRYNAFDELVWQKNAKGQIVEMIYDKLGRMTQRTEEEGISTWTYDTKSHGVGKLSAEYAPHANGFSRTYGYDAFGRPTQVNTSIDTKGTFLVQTAYDESGRVRQRTQPGEFTLENVYNQYGYLSGIRTPKTQINDYDFDALETIKVDALAEATKLIDTSVQYMEEIERYQKRADSYKILSDKDQVLETIIQMLGSAAGALEFDGAYDFNLNNIKSFDGLRTKLCAKTSTLDFFLMNAKTISDIKLSLYMSFGVPEIVGKNLFIDQLNQWLRNPDLQNHLADIRNEYTGTVTRPGITLTQKTRDAISAYTQHPSSIALQRLNRLILKDAYPDEIKSPPAIWDNSLPAVVNSLERALTLFGSLQNAHDTLQTSGATLDLLTSTALELKNAALENLNLATNYLDKADKIKVAQLQRNAAIYAGMIDTNYHYFWKAESRDESNRLSRFIFGNGLVTKRSYDSSTGHLSQITTGFEYGNTPFIRNLEYTYDAVNNVKTRKDTIQNLTETFGYDHLNRLTESNFGGQAIGYAYDAMGNMTNKSDVGTYVYGSETAGPHAITFDGANSFTYDANGNMISGKGKTIDWTSFDKPWRFTKGALKNAFFYGPDRARYMKTVTDDDRTSESLYIGKGYERETINGVISHKYFVYADGQLVGIHKKIRNSADQTKYLHRDSLGSIDTVTNGLGNPDERKSYQPFGKPRSLGATTPTSSSSFTNRGFTGHEHIDDMGLIHMNGRVYDPELGRFLSPDTLIQDPYSSQSYNRYSYCVNNPLQYTDPSGHFFGIFAAITLVGFLESVLVGAAIGAAVGGIMAAITGGSVLEGIKVGAISGAISGAIFGGIHFLPGMGEVALAGGVHFGPVIQAAIHAGGGALAGGITASIQGADVGTGILTGAIGAGLGKYAGMKFLSGKGFETQLAGRTLVGGVTGGIGAEISGDDFGNGFTTGAASASIGFLCNDRLGWLRKAASSYWKAAKLTPEKVDRLGKYMKTSVEYSGLKNMPELARSTGVAMGAGAALLVGYAAYPMAMVLAGTPYGQTILNDAVPTLLGSILPSPPSPPNTVTGSIMTIYDFIKYPDKYLKINQE